MIAVQTKNLTLDGALIFQKELRKGKLRLEGNQKINKLGLEGEPKNQRKIYM